MIERSPTVYLVDDDASVLKALARLLKTSGFDTRPCPSAQSFLDQYDPCLPGCIILDVAMPVLTGLDVQHLLGPSHTVIQPIIFISGRSDIPTSVTAMKNGAVDFLTKPVDESVLLAAVKTAIVKSQALLQQRQERNSIEARFARLTRREKEVLHLVVSGSLNKQVAASLGIAERTVKIHRSRLMRKMSARTLAELVHLESRIGGADRAAAL